MGVLKFVAKTLYGLENVLASELKELGASDVEPANRAVMFRGDKELLYRVNYCARTALSVLMPFAGFNITSKEDLYKKSYEINWPGLMDPAMTFSIVPVVNSKIFSHNAYPGLVVKDAIADHFRNRTGRRPSVDTENPDLLINVHISGSRVSLSLDSSVIPLYKRGYRIEQGKAPLNEVLAAGILMLSGWDASRPLLDPMCGSGTIPIEAGLMANKVPPGIFRSFFGFSRWKEYDEKLFRKVKKESDTMIIRSKSNIYGTDISGEAIRQSVINSEKAGLKDVISFKVADLKDIKPVKKEGYLIFNPPYGQRLQVNELTDLYKLIGSKLKHNFPGHKAWIITSGKEYLNIIGLKPRVKYKLFNGSIECILAGYEMYEGSRKGNYF
jgi:putative N6-adenine-specific DNA methylase